MSNEPNKIIYSMIGVSKSYDKKVVLKDIYLSYFYGAKIGVLGLNGSGKSSLLKILAGGGKKIWGGGGGGGGKNVRGRWRCRRGIRRDIWSRSRSSIRPRRFGRSWRRG